jgi:DNA repair photolyase
VGRCRSALKTWNPITGCLHGCTYCWAQRFARRLATWGTEPYRTRQFRPAFAEWRLQRVPKGDLFVGDMGDMWGDWVPPAWITRVLAALRRRRGGGHLFLTKNPRRYHEFRDAFTENMMLGVTIESNRAHPVSQAPPPRERFEAMEALRWPNKAVVIEPILDFDDELIAWIEAIAPVTVYVGYDNYHHHLPEPCLAKTEALIRALGHRTEVTARALRPAWHERPVDARSGQPS